MLKAELAVVGAGPAGLACAIEAARAGVHTVVVDENDRPGGQLFKQIHKFFGSAEHWAGRRGFEIGEELLAEASRLGIRVLLRHAAVGLRLGEEGGFELWVWDQARGLLGRLSADRVAIATGASENALAFPGWTLPGVMGAGAVQTLLNVHRVLPGRRVLMVGSGNVGLIVSCQLLQAGVRAVTVVESAAAVGGYEVHAAKIRRYGVPILLRTTVRRAWGDGRTKGVTLVRLDDNGSPIPGSEEDLAVDLVCVATGLSPLAELAWLAGCKFTYSPILGGFVPVHGPDMQTSVRGVYVAGDASGVEEASVALEEGRLAGVSVAMSLGRTDLERGQRAQAEIARRLEDLRRGPFGEKRQHAKQWIHDQVVGA
ncbi:MAG: NAD(P)/FAD-dependent oxidoreductase [Candidatus Bipolaricaulota bacterium]|nr:NAD(P)/FAD-dependent oxidoreductase [Bacillota bacterium]